MPAAPPVAGTTPASASLPAATPPPAPAVGLLSPAPSSMDASSAPGWASGTSALDDATPIAPDGTWALDTAGAGGPCRTWPVQRDCAGSCLPDDWSQWTPDHRIAVETATEILWRLTAGRFGLCRETVRPCAADSPGWPSAPGYGPLSAYSGHIPPPLPSGYGYGALPAAGCGCVGVCGCSTADELELPGPVHDADPYRLEVWQDGALLLTGWRLIGDRIVRTDGKTWPVRQPMHLPLAAPPGQPAASVGTFGVVYWRGMQVPPGGRRAVTLLACELWKACHKPNECRLPASVVEVQRQGVTYRVADPQTFLEQGRVGITHIDLWIASVNPRSVRSPSVVMTPDATTWRSERTTGEIGGPA